MSGRFIARGLYRLGTASAAVRLGGSPLVLPVSASLIACIVFAAGFIPGIAHSMVNGSRLLALTSALASTPAFASTPTPVAYSPFSAGLGLARASVGASDRAVSAGVPGHGHSTPYGRDGGPGGVRYGGDLASLDTLAPAGSRMLTLTSLSATPATSATSATSATPTPTQTPTPGCDLAWNPVQSPNRDYQTNILTSIVAPSSSDIWAVGVSGYTQAQILHWNGVQWSLVPYSGTGVIGSLAAVSPENIWGVGTSIGHWNGTQWTLSALPFQGELNSISAVSADSIWAVGDGPGDSTLVAHWDGANWSPVPAPNPSGTHNYLHGVWARSDTDVWAVGSTWNGFTAVSESLILHWDGAQWVRISSPSPNPLGSYDNELYAVGGAGGAQAGGTNDAWAVGSSLVLHWDGTAWSQAQAPSAALYGVAALSSSAVWAVGGNVDQNGVEKTVVLRWDGSVWRQEPSADPDPSGNLLRSAVATSLDNLWAVGYTGLNLSGSITRTLTEHYFDPCATPTSSATGTPPTLTPTRTQTPGTSSPTRSATPLYTRTFTATPTATLPCGSAWHPVFSQNPSSNNTLNAVDAISPTDIWAVGALADSVGNANTLTEHWDGVQWTTVPSPNFSETNVLVGVSGVASNDVWAVGYYGSTEGYVLILHWDGTTWRQVPGANPDAQSNSLWSVVALAPGNVWAVGEYGPYSHYTLIEHWNGTVWAQVPRTNLDGSSNRLSSISGSPANPNDLWAVGYGGALTLAEHWNGSTWASVSTPNQGSSNVLNGVISLSPSDAWAVGSSSQTSQGDSTLIEHWNGGQWTIVPGPHQGHLKSVSATSPNDVWAVGDTGLPGFEQPLALHWDGTAWNQVAIPNVGMYPNKLLSVSALRADDVWSVGWYASTGSYTSPKQTLAEHYYDPCSSSVTSTPTPTSMVSPTLTVPVIATSTMTGTLTRTMTGTATATATATGTSTATVRVSFTPSSTNTPVSCSISYTDVDQSSAFYSYIQCLTCRGIVGGFSDGSFRPNAPVTRGQAAKIISNAAEYTDQISAGTQTFGDVPPSSPFWVFVERVYLHGAISGYPCGAPGDPGEPCPGSYFRPGANLTRGQLAKIATSVAGYTDPASGQAFMDVPSSQPFYIYIERAHLHNIISGYGCGASGEPCPGAYYRSALNVTRGQTAKIVSGTFFPGCQTPLSGASRP